MKKTITVFTPTYNRSYCLGRCYESLLRQSCKDFVWMIIDDGSSDNTKQLVEEWIKDNQIQIIYHQQENQGMHGAHNTAYKMIDTELNVCIDSDDYMPEHAIEKIISFWRKHGSSSYSGLIALDANAHNDEIIGTRLPDNLKSSTLFDLYYKHGVTGDKKLVYRTKLTKKYPYPLFENEKYVGLAYKYYLLDTQYEILLMNEVICSVEYLPDGSSLNMIHQYKRNPNGFAFYRKELMKLPFTSNVFKFRQAIHFVSSSLLGKNKSFLKDTPKKAYTIVAIPFGILLYAYIMAKTRTMS